MSGLQLPGNASAPAVHESATSIWLIRAPFTFLAVLLLLSKPLFARINIRDFRFWFLMFLVWFTMSVVWSTFPIITAGKALEFVTAALIVLQASRDQYALQRLEGIYSLTLLYLSLLALISLLGFVARVPSFVTTGGHGLFSNTIANSPFFSGNGLGYISISLLLVGYAEWQFCGVKGTRGLFQLIFPFATYGVASSRTSLVILLLGVLVILFRKSKVLLITFSISTGTAIVFFRGAILHRLQGSESTGNMENLTGRTVMWVAALREWRKRPWIGYGGGAGGKYVLSRIADVGAAKMSNLHSGLMECLSGLGIIGFVLGVSILAWASISALRSWKKYPSYSGLYIWVISFWITSIMSIGVLGWMGGTVTIYLVLLAHLDVLRRGGANVGYAPMPSALIDNG